MRLLHFLDVSALFRAKLYDNSSIICTKSWKRNCKICKNLFYFFCKVLELDYQCLRYIINILCISADIYVNVVVLIYFHLYLGGKISIVFSLLLLDIFFWNLIFKLCLYWFNSSIAIILHWLILSNPCYPNASIFF